MKKILTAHKIAKIKGAKISLWTNSPKLRAAKIKGFTVHVLVILTTVFKAKCMACSDETIFMSSTSIM